METLTTNIVMLHSFPAGGKSTLAKKYIQKGYKILSRDVEGGSTKDLIDKLKNLLESGEKVCLDSTHRTKAVREPFITLAKELNITIGCHIIEGVAKRFTNPFNEKIIRVSSKDSMKEEALINSLKRMVTLNNKVYMCRQDVPGDVLKDGQSFILPAIFVHAKEMQVPNKSEGFDKILTTNFIREKSESRLNKAIFVDLDSTVRKTKSGDKYPLTKEDVEILPNSKKILTYYKELGYKIIAITNQSGVERNHLTFEKAEEIVKYTNSLLNNVLDDWYICPHFPTKTSCYCRKPQSGVGIYFEHKYDLDLTKCIMVGDMLTDFNFARRLDIQFTTEKEFFNRS